MPPPGRPGAQAAASTGPGVGSTARAGAASWLVDRLVLIANRPRLLVATTVGNLVACGLVYAVLEGSGPVTGVWWAIVTGFTVGYGDFYPASTGGRAVGAYLIVSMFVLALCLGANITARLIRDEHEWSHDEQEGVKASQARVEAALARVEARLAAGRESGPTAEA